MLKNNKNDTYIKNYVGAMEEVKLRINSIEELYKHAEIPPLIHKSIIIDSAALQIRKVLELIAFASLVANKQIYSEKWKNFRKDWEAGKIIKKLEKINPNFYPVSLIYDETSQELTNRINNYLTKDIFAEVYGKFGDILHRCNPFKRLIGEKYYQKYADFIYESLENIMNLLDIHAIRIVNEDTVWVVFMNRDSNNTVSCRPFKKYD